MAWTSGTVKIETQKSSDNRTTTMIMDVHELNSDEARSAYIPTESLHPTVIWRNDIPSAWSLFK